MSAAPDKYDDETPLRLAIAAAIAFPDGSVSIGALRREAERGRLAIERIGGRDYTTLSAIKDMRRACRIKPKAEAPGATDSESNFSSEEERESAARAAVLASLNALKKPSARTSQKSSTGSKAK